MITEEIRKERRNYIGGSDMPIIMGLSSYKTPYKLYLEKLGLIESEDKETELQYWGNALEATIVKHFEKINNVVVEQKPTLSHKEHDFIRANLDGFIPELNAVLEVKCSDKYMRNEWGEDGTDVIPMPYLVQVAHYCAVTGADKAYIAVLIGGNEYRQFVYNRDMRVEAIVIEAAKQFWHCVQNQIEPEPINIDDCKLKYSKVDPDKIITPDEAIRNELNRLAKTKQQLKELEKIEKESMKEIMEYMKDAEAIADESGKPLVTWKQTKNGYRRFALKGVSE